MLVVITLKSPAQVTYDDMMIDCAVGMISEVVYQSVVGLIYNFHFVYFFQEGKCFTMLSHSTQNVTQILTEVE